ncbi:hypothetical protein MGSAQ_002119 [marine sediment metagenome]|uniref:Uncharacterized protein n=1 Tax=marine sediment metagenome TaxID=412755 RepID=A0A1B6NSD0_9ZZZZ
MNSVGVPARIKFFAMASATYSAAPNMVPTMISKCLLIIRLLLYLQLSSST